MLLSANAQRGLTGAHVRPTSMSVRQLRRALASMGERARIPSAVTHAAARGSGRGKTAASVALPTVLIAPLMVSLACSVWKDLMSILTTHAVSLHAQIICYV